MIEPYYQDNWTTLFNGDCREVLASLPDESVNCVVTSPPYFGLRDYGTATWEGGNSDCQHTGVARRCEKEGRNDKQSTQKGSSSDKVSRDCLLCGATRVDSQIGLEQSPEDYIAQLVSVFREVRRVLRDDGTVWLNLGDSYASQAGGYDTTGSRGTSATVSAKTQAAILSGKDRRVPAGLKPKDLIGIPWRVAFALQADGWYLRSDIVWNKPNPMPESVTDRPTKSHEYIFLLSKSEKYFYNGDAIKEPVAESTIGRGKVDFGGAKGRNYQPEPDDPNFRSGKEQWGRTFDYKESCRNGRNKRSVWTVATKPYAEAHFAVFPPDLIRPCILAGCPIGGVVLDPFAGSGTTLQVAREAQCKSIGIELNPDYCRLIEKRLSQGVFAYA